MEFKKILPAAAGVIALTSSIAFADGNRGPQEESLRVRISDSELLGDPAEDAASSFAIGSASGSIYHVSIMHGETTRVVLIDAQTGWVIRSV
jgi:hypothetical protein